METHSRLNAATLQAVINHAQADVAALRESSALADFLTAHAVGDSKASVASTAEWRSRFAGRFAGELKSKLPYYGIRIIGTAGGGKELIRVDREGPDGTVRVASDGDLHFRGDEEDVQQTMKLPPGATYVSEVFLKTDEAGIVKEPHIPIVRVATPLFAANGVPFGSVGIDIDLRQLFARIRAKADSISTTWLLNSKGEFLFNPDPDRGFAYYGGQRHRIYDEFPSYDEALARGLNGNAVWTNRDGRRAGVGWASVQLNGVSKITAIEATSFSKLNIGFEAVRRSAVLAGSLAVLFAVLLSFVLAKSLTKPLEEITSAVGSLTSGELVVFPRGGGAEIGVLSTAFERMASEIRQKSELLQNTIGSIADPILVADQDGNIVIANEAAKRLLGINPGVRGVSREKSFELFEAGGAIPLPFDRDALSHALKGNSIDNLPVVIKSSEQRYDMLVTGRPLRDGNGRVVGAVAVYHDITDFKRAITALSANERVAKLIVETALDAFIQGDAEGTILEWSPKAEAMLGWTRSEAVGRSLRHLVVPARNQEKNRERVARLVREAGTETSGMRYSAPSLRKDGTEIMTEISATAMKTANGVVINCFMRDITQQRAAELQLQQLERMDSIGQLTGGIAHDFNNMLTVITGTVDILADGVSDRPSLTAIVRLIHQAADRGAKLTANLLSFARQQPLQPAPVDANALISDASNLLQSTLGRQVTIRTELDREAWHASVDPAQLNAALVNLAINARDAMPKGGDLTLRTANVTVSDASANPHIEPGQYLTIEVADTGSGIPDAIKDKIFEPFFTTKERGKGTGLGLSVVYGFVKQSGGHIELETAPDKGTLFRIYLPKADDEEQQSHPLQGASMPDLGSETILCVEDDPMVQKFIFAQLESFGYRILRATNAAEALYIVDAGQPFDLLFTDVVMPGAMNGFELADEVVARKPGTRVLFTTGFEDGNIESHGPVAPGLLLAKPYLRSELANKIREALRREPTWLTPERRRRM